MKIEKKRLIAVIGIFFVAIYLSPAFPALLLYCSSSYQPLNVYPCLSVSGKVISLSL